MDLGMIFYFLSLIIMPLAGILMWMKKRNGWILTTFYFAYVTAGAIPLFLSAFNRRSTGNEAIDALFLMDSPVYHLGTLLLFGVATWAMTKVDIREVYKVDKQTMVISICSGVGMILVQRISL